MREFIGYHGTTKKRAVGIIKNGFLPSRKSTEWLGHGIYFFDSKGWADIWARQFASNEKDEPSILSAMLSCDENEFLDLDVHENMKKLEVEMSELFSGKNKSGHLNFKTSSELRCAACNAWCLKYSVKIFAYTFQGVKYNGVGFPTYNEQRQFCVKSKENICSVREESMEDEDNAI